MEIAARSFVFGGNFIGIVFVVAFVLAIVLAGSHIGSDVMNRRDVSKFKKEMRDSMNGGKDKTNSRFSAFDNAPYGWDQDPQLSVQRKAKRKMEPVKLSPGTIIFCLVVLLVAMS